MNKDGREPEEAAPAPDESGGGAPSAVVGALSAAPTLTMAAAGSASASERSLIGHWLGPYQILSRLGGGGMGEVFVATDAILERRVALKLLRADYTNDGDRVRRFVQEAKAASALNHPNIVSI